MSVYNFDKIESIIERHKRYRKLKKGAKEGKLTEREMWEYKIVNGLIKLGLLYFIFSVVINIL